MVSNLRLGYQPSGEKWFGFDLATGLKGLPPEILMIPLAGHTPGHAGIAIQTASGWLLHGGDAWFCRGEIEQERRCTPGLRFYQWLMSMNRDARLANQQRLRELAGHHGSEITLFCSHDALELEKMVAKNP